MTHTIACATHKGGIGKTTTAVNLARELTVTHGRRCLLVDLSTHGNASDHVGVQIPRGDFTPVAQVLIGAAKCHATVQSTAFGMDLLAGGQGTSAAEGVLQQLEGGRDRLRRALAGGPWDVVLLDCGPEHNAVLQAALRAATCVLVPLQLEYFALQGFRSFLETIEAERAHNPGLRMAGWFPVRAASTSLARDVLEQARALCGPLELPTIRQDTRLATAPGWHKPALDFDPKCRGVEDYRQLAAALVARGCA